MSDNVILFILLDDNKILYLYELGATDTRMVRAREMNKNLSRHVDGVPELIDEFLTKINNYENKDQHEARKKHTISNKFVVAELLTPTENVFNARGGSKNYQFSASQELREKEFVSFLDKMPNGYSLNQYVREVWFHKFITDPNGLIFMEVTNKVDEDNVIEPTYKNIHSIRAYRQNGIFVDWVIFEPHNIEKDESNEDEKEIFWVVDKEGYYEYEFKKGNKEVTLTLINEIPHDFEMVPAVLCSNITDNFPICDSIYTNDWKKSPIDNQVELLDKYLVSNSVLSLQEFMHAYAREWEYADECVKCNGTGKIQQEGRNGMHYTDCDCSNGMFTRKDPTDSIKLKIPNADEVRIDPPFGYVYLPVEAHKMQVDLVDRYFELTFRSQWNATREKSDNETATGRFIDVQPVNNRLDMYSKTTETIHTSLANFIGNYYFPETFERAYIQYGRRYLIETPDQIWEKYLKAKEKKAPVSSLDLLLFQYLESEFRENEKMMMYEVKKAKLEPFVHNTIELIRSSHYIAEIDKKKKEYFNEYIKTKSIDYVIENDFEKLDNELIEFANQKQLNETIQQTSL